MKRASSEALGKLLLFGDWPIKNNIVFVFFDGVYEESEENIWNNIQMEVQRLYSHVLQFREAKNIFTISL